MFHIKYFYQNDGGIKSKDGKEMEWMIDRKSPDAKDVLTLVGGVDTLEKLS